MPGKKPADPAILDALKSAEKQLLRLGRIIDESFSEVYVFNAETLQFVQVSQGAQKNLGYTMEELESLTPLDLKPEFSRESFEALLEPLRNGEQDHVPLETMHRRKDGSRYPVEVRVYISHTESPPVFYAIILDVTKKHEHEQALLISEERFRNVAQATLDTIWDWDLQTDSVWWNAGMQSQFGYLPEEIEPDSSGWTRRIHPDDRDEVVTSIHAVIDGMENNWQAKYRFQRKDGIYALVVDRGFVIRDKQCKALRMLGGMTDITEKAALEEQLHQAQRLEALGQLTGGVAHDFNNHLTVIKGNAELISERVAGDRQLADLAAMISAAAERGAELTRRLLAFSRKQPLAPQAVDVNQLVTNMDILLRRTLGEHIEIEFVRGAGLWPALIDPSQLENALLNLCLNARDAMLAGGKLTIETANIRIDDHYADYHADITPGQYVLLAVSDTGTGISEQDMPHLFEPFFTTKETGKGTGLGLSMVYGLIKQSAGHVSVYSESGEGATVKLYLPRVIGQQSPVAYRKNVARADGGMETVLLVEDDDLVRHYAEAQIRTLGYRVLVAENGQQALEILQQEDKIDLLFADVVMPGGMNGRELADAARKLRPNLKVLFASGYTENAIVHHGRLDPNVLLLNKPYQRKELARMLRKALAQK